MTFKKDGTYIEGSVESMYLTEEEKAARAAARGNATEAPASAGAPSTPAGSSGRPKLDLNALRRRVAPSTETAPAETTSTIEKVEEPKPVEKVKEVEAAMPNWSDGKAEELGAAVAALSEEPAVEEPAPAPVAEETAPATEPVSKAAMPDSLPLNQVSGKEKQEEEPKPAEDVVPEIKLEEETPAEKAEEPAPVAEPEQPQAQDGKPEVLDPTLKTGSFNVIDLPTLLGILAPNGAIFDQSILVNWIGKCLVKYNQAPTNIFSAKFDKRVRFINFNYLDNRINVVVTYGDNVVCLAYNQARQEIKDVSKQMTPDGSKVSYRGHLMATYSELSRKTLEV